MRLTLLQSSAIPIHYHAYHALRFAAPTMAPSRPSPPVLLLLPLLLATIAIASHSTPTAPTVPSALQVDVVIIGAGWAGMSAAATLARANVSFLVLEVSNRTGGRSHAVEFGDPRVWRGVVERGSNWVSGVAPPHVVKGGAGGVAKGMKHLPYENPVRTLAREANISLTRIPGSADGNMSGYDVVFRSGEEA